MGKSFRQNPTEFFLSAAPGEAESPSGTAPVESTERLPEQRLRRETKSRRLQILIRPGTYERLKRLSESRGQSVNDLINEILEDYLNKQERSGK